MFTFQSSSLYSSSSLQQPHALFVEPCAPLPCLYSLPQLTYQNVSVQCLISSKFLCALVLLANLSQAIKVFLFRQFLQSLVHITRRNWRTKDKSSQPPTSASYTRAQLQTHLSPSIWLLHLNKGF